jgi:hypothetical protein
MRFLLDSLVQTPAYVVYAKYDVLAWNSLATNLIGDLSTFPDTDRNMLRWTFARSETSWHWSDADTVNFARSLGADLRASYAQYPADPLASPRSSPSCSARAAGSRPGGPTTTSRSEGLRRPRLRWVRRLRDHGNLMITVI